MKMKIDNDFEIKVKCKQHNIVALEIDDIEEDLVIAAYGDSNTPSIILQNKITREFCHVQFDEFIGFKVWTADLNYDSLKICLIK